MKILVFWNEMSWWDLISFAQIAPKNSHGKSNMFIKSQEACKKTAISLSYFNFLLLFSTKRSAQDEIQLYFYSNRNAIVQRMTLNWVCFIGSLGSWVKIIKTSSVQGSSLINSDVWSQVPIESTFNTSTSKNSSQFSVQFLMYGFAKNPVSYYNIRSKIKKSQ